MSVQNNPNAVGASESHAPATGPATEGQIKVGEPPATHKIEKQEGQPPVGSAQDRINAGHGTVAQALHSSGESRVVEHSLPPTTGNIAEHRTFSLEMPQIAVDLQSLSFASIVQGGTTESSLSLPVLTDSSSAVADLGGWDDWGSVQMDGGVKSIISELVVVPTLDINFSSNLNDVNKSNLAEPPSLLGIQASIFQHQDKHVTLLKFTDQHEFNETNFFSPLRNFHQVDGLPISTITALDKDVMYIPLPQNLFSSAEEIRHILDQVVSHNQRNNIDVKSIVLIGLTEKGWTKFSTSLTNFVSLQKKNIDADHIEKKEETKKSDAPKKKISIHTHKRADSNDASRRREPETSDHESLLKLDIRRMENNITEAARKKESEQKVEAFEIDRKIRHTEQDESNRQQKASEHRRRDS